MIKLILVAGEDTKRLSDYLSDRGTFNVEHCFSSLKQEEAQIKSSIIHADKLVYICKDNSKWIRQDMQYLIDLLSSDSFFNVNEIIFLQQETKTSKQTTDYFNAAMSACNFSNYTIKELKGALTFADIYSAILGITKVSEAPSVFRNVYFKERDSDALKVYSEKDNSKYLIEPFNFDNLAKYEAAKKVSDRIDSGALINENEASTLNKYDEPEFTLFRQNTQTTVERTFIFAGDKHSGKAVWSLNFATSARAAGHRVIFFDFTRSQSAEQMLKSSGVDYYSTNIGRLIKGDEPFHSNLTLVNLPEEVCDLKIEILKSFNRRYTLTPDDVVIVLTEIQDLTAIVEYLKDRLTKIYCTLVPLRWEIEPLKTTIKSIKSAHRPCILLNRAISLMDAQSYAESADIRAQLGGSLKIVDAIDFPDLNRDEQLFNTLMEVIDIE